MNRCKDEIIIGRNAVLAALKAGRPAVSLLVTAAAGKSLPHIIRECKDRKIPIKEVERAKLDEMSEMAVHQGVILLAAAASYSQLEDILDLAKERDEPPFVIICDGIEDPHNLGAIVRTAEAVGAHGVIIPARRSAGLTTAMAKAASGALEYIPVCRVTNISQTIDTLKTHGLWIYGAAVGGQVWHKADLLGPAAVVIGSEGKGMSALVEKKCDALVSIPMAGQITSLNASVAAGIIMFEIRRQRDNGSGELIVDS